MTGLPALGIPECANDRGIRWKELVGVEVGDVDPSNSLTLEAGGNTLPLCDAEEFKFDSSIRVLVGQVHEWLDGRRLDSNFFEEFAFERDKRGLACMDFATGKFPEIAIGTCFNTLGDQYLSARVAQYARSDMKMLHRGGLG